jgi:hypothetical protein
LINIVDPKERRVRKKANISKMLETLLDKHARPKSQRKRKESRRE